MLCSRSPCAGRILLAPAKLTAGLQAAVASREGSHLPRAVMAPEGSKTGPTVVKHTNASHLPAFFNLRRHCQPGQRVAVLGNVPELSKWNTESISMFLEPFEIDGETDSMVSKEDVKDLWCGTSELPAGELLEFKFVVVDENGHVTWVNDLEGVGEKNLKLKVEECAHLWLEEAFVDVWPAVELVYGNEDEGDEDVDKVEEGAV